MARYARTDVKSFSSSKNKVTPNTYKKKHVFSSVTSYSPDTQEVFYTFKRVNVNGKYRVRTYQVLNPSEVRKKQKPDLFLVDSRRAGSFKQSKQLATKGKLGYKFKQVVATDVKGKHTYEYFSKRKPSRTGTKKEGKFKGQKYRIQLVAYFVAATKKKRVVVLGYTDGYMAGKTPSKDLLLGECEKRARGEAGHLLGTSEFTLNLIDHGWRYYGEG